MAAITDILAAVKSALVTLYPSIPVKTSKRPAVIGRHLEAGWSLGYPLPCLVLSCADPEEIDGAGSFEHVSVGYRVVVEYLKSPNAAVAGAADEGHPPSVAEDPDVRDKRQAIRAALYKTLSGVAGVFAVRHETLAPYGLPPENAAKVVASGEEFRFTATEVRP